MQSIKWQPARRKLLNAATATDRTQHGTSTAPKGTKQVRNSTRRESVHPFIYQIMHSNVVSILQYNLNRSKLRTYSILNDPTSEKFAVLAPQEQYWSDFTNSSLTHDKWRLVEPSPDPEGKKPRSVFYVNRRLLATKDFEIIYMPFRDVTAIAISTDQPKPLLLINIYNPHKYDLMTPLEQYLHNTINL